MALWMSVLVGCTDQAAGITVPDAGSIAATSCSGYHHGVKSCADLLCPNGPETDLQCYEAHVPCWCFSQQSWCMPE